MSRRKHVIAALFATLVVGSIIWWIVDPESPHPIEKRNESNVAMPTDTQMATTDSGSRAGEAYLSDLEHSRTRVLLPKAVRRPWEGAIFTSENAFDKGRKSTVADVLPGWIRRALREGNSDLAAGYLWTLVKLGEDDVPEVSTKAIIGIYQLGDIDGFAHRKISTWIAGITDSKLWISGLWKGDYVDIRERALQEFEFFKDKSFDELIYDTWIKHRSAERNQLASVDFAYYLEKHGRKLPEGYWLERLDIPYGFANALEIAEKQRAPQASEKMSTLFERLKGMREGSIDVGRAASLASVLFRITGEPRYRDYLAKQAEEMIASSSFPSGIDKFLDGLAAANDKKALNIVSAAMQHKNGVVREMAIAALGKSSDPISTEILFDAASEKVKAGTGFPGAEMRALVTQNNASADAKYDRLKQALMSGKLAWKASIRDFDELDFFRKHGRK